MKKLLVICGPTASGKTALAVKCAEALNGEIVSADAFLVYRGLNIGTAKPTEEERGGIAHHLIDVADPREDFSVSDYERLALAAVEDILSRGKTPVLCGGTGFYLNAVLYAHAFGNAPASKEIRARLAKIAEEEGREALHARLADVDPASAAVLHPNDVKRVIRALEIFELTGKRKSDQRDGSAPRYPFAAFSYDYPRAELYERIRRRTQEMICRGLVDEVKGLLARGVPPTAQSMQAIGYKEVVDFLKNSYNLGTMSDIIEKNTRNYAKRQLTFFKRMADLHLLAPRDLHDVVREVTQIYECE